MELGGHGEEGEENLPPPGPEGEAAEEEEESAGNLEENLEQSQPEEEEEKDQLTEELSQNVVEKNEYQLRPRGTLRRPARFLLVQVWEAYMENAREKGRKMYTRVTVLPNQLSEAQWEEVKLKPILKSNCQDTSVPSSHDRKVQFSCNNQAAVFHYKLPVTDLTGEANWGTIMAVDLKDYFHQPVVYFSPFIGDLGRSFREASILKEREESAQLIKWTNNQKNGKVE